MRTAALVLCGAFALACGSARAPGPPPIRFLHTFSPAETELFNRVVGESREFTVDATLVPFARGQQVISEILRSGTDCPDLIRIDATWLPGLRDHLVAVPSELAARDWTSEARALGDDRAVAQSTDGLVVVRDRGLPAPRDASIAALIEASRARASQFPLAVRVDGYWALPWLRSHGVELGAIDDSGDGAIAAIEEFAALFGDLAAPPPPGGSEAPDELRRWRTGELAYWVTGPWLLGELDQTRVAVTPLANAPRGGQLLVVPRCAARAEDGWRLAATLTDSGVEVRFAEAFATVPTRATALANSPLLVRQLASALATARPLPRAVTTPLLFDDLNPAIAAVVARDASAEEAVAGVRRAWHRIAARSQQ